jgi:hypothetical protein
MKLTKYSSNRLLNTFALWDVSKEYAECLMNYLVHGFHPGSFWYYVLVNDFNRAIMSSHPGNTIPALKNVVGWMNDYRLRGAPGRVWGSQEIVEEWLELSSQERRTTLEALGLIYTEKEEMILILRDEPTHEPTLW